MFGSASVAEEVCHLNRWDQCSLPINALETALELRQLDTLAFFLRSRDNGKYYSGMLREYLFSGLDYFQSKSLNNLSFVSGKTS